MPILLGSRLSDGWNEQVTGKFKSIHSIENPTPHAHNATRTPTTDLISGARFDAPAVGAGVRAEPEVDAVVDARAEAKVELGTLATAVIEEMVICV